MSRKTSTADRIQNLRKAIGLNQEVLAKKVGVKRLATVRWENGEATPSAGNYIGLAKLAQKHGMHSEALWFWNEAGVAIPDLRALVPEINKAFKEYERRVFEIRPAGEVVRLPLLDNAFFDGSPESVLLRLSALPMEAHPESVPLPPKLALRPLATFCIHAPDDFMRPMFHRGDTLAVDISSGSVIAPDVSTPLVKELVGLSFPALVAAYHAPVQAKTVLGPPRLRAGLHVRYLWSVASEVHLSTLVGDQVQQTPPQFREAYADKKELEESRDVVVTGDPQWLMVGSVKMWIGRNRGQRQR